MVRGVMIYDLRAEHEGGGAAGGTRAQIGGSTATERRGYKEKCVTEAGRKNKGGTLAPLWARMVA
jgi:hypothetical protein